MSANSPSRRPLIVVPAWNEQETVANTIHEIHRALPEVDVVVVSDGSTDATAAIAKAAGAMVLDLPFNLGVGGAMRAGFRYAVRHGYDAVVQVDADGQHDPTEVPLLLARLVDADVVIGARFAEAGDYRVRGPRRWAMVVLAKVLSWLAKSKLTDTTSGFKASGPRALPLFAACYPVEYLGDTIESLVIASRAGCRITQVPVHMRPRQGGTPSNSAWKSSLYLFRAGFALLLALVRTWDTPLPSAQVSFSATTTDAVEAPPASRTEGGITR